MVLLSHQSHFKSKTDTLISTCTGVNSKYLFLGQKSWMTLISIVDQYIAMVRQITRIENAGRDFFKASFALKCMVTAPDIKTANPNAAGLVRKGSHTPVIRSKAKSILRIPMAGMDHSGSP